MYWLRNFLGMPFDKQYDKQFKKQFNKIIVIDDILQALDERKVFELIKSKGISILRYDDFVGMFSLDIYDYIRKILPKTKFVNDIIKYEIENIQNSSEKEELYNMYLVKYFISDVIENKHVDLDTLFEFCTTITDYYIERVEQQKGLKTYLINIAYTIFFKVPDRILSYLKYVIKETNDISYLSIVFSPTLEDDTFEIKHKDEIKRIIYNNYHRNGFRELFIKLYHYINTIRHHDEKIKIFRGMFNPDKILDIMINKESAKGEPWRFSSAVMNPFLQAFPEMIEVVIDEIIETRDIQGAINICENRTFEKEQVKRLTKLVDNYGNNDHKYHFYQTCAYLNRKADLQNIKVT